MQTPVIADPRPVGRPLGIEARAILQSLSAAPKPARAVATELGIPARSVDRLMSRLVARGAVCVVELRRLPQASRPIAVYQAARGGRSIPTHWMEQKNEQ